MKSVRTHMLIFFGATTAILLIIMAVMVIIQVNTSFTSMTKSNGSMIVDARADEIGRIVYGYTREILEISREPIFQSANIRDVREYWRNNSKEIRKNINNDFNYLVYATVSGATLTTTMNTTNISDRGYFKAVVREGKESSVSMPLISRTTGEKMFIIATPVIDKDTKKVIGMLGASITLESLSKIAAGIKIGKSGYGWIVDGSGLAIAHPKKDYVMKLNLLKPEEHKFKGLEEAGKMMVAGKSGTVSIESQAGKKLTVIFASISNTPNWSLGLTMQDSEFYEQGYLLLRTILIIMAVIFAVMFVAINFVARLIAMPLKTAAEHLEKIGEGDLTGKLPAKFLEKKDEVGVISMGIEIMQQSIRKIMANIQSLSQELATASEEMTSTSSSFSENTQTSASTIEEITASIEEISAGMDMVSTNSGNQTSKLKSLTEKMDELLHAVEQMRQMISDALAEGDRIAGISRESAGALEMMNKSINAIMVSSGDMMNIIGIINGISEQINLLSLNAAIEAARAGEAGTGFAVVASEISNLSDKTAESIKIIDTLIKQNSTEIEKGKKAMETTGDTIKSITGGMESIAVKIRNLSSHMEQQTSIYTGTRDVTSEVRVISEQIIQSIEEQKIAVREVMQSTSSMNDVTQNNAASAEEMSGSMESMSLLAERLNAEADSFKI